MNSFNKIHQSGLLDIKNMSIGFDKDLKKISDIREVLIYCSNPNLINEEGEPLWYIAMKNNNLEGLLLLLSNNVEVYRKNRNKDSWIMSCIKYSVPEYILISGLNMENDDWFKPNKDGQSPFFDLNIKKEYAEIIALKYWTEVRSWEDLKNKEGEDPVCFFKKHNKESIYKTFKYWKSISLRG